MGCYMGGIWGVVAAEENDSNCGQDHWYIFQGVWVSYEDDKKGDWM